MLTAGIFASMILTIIGLGFVFICLSVRAIRSFRKEMPEKYGIKQIGASIMRFRDAADGIDLERQLAKIFPNEHELPSQQSAPSHHD